MSGEIGGFPWCAALCEIVWCGDQEQAYLSYSLCEKSRIGESTYSNRDVNAFLDQVEIAVVENEFDPHFGKGLKESDNQWRNVPAAELQWCCNAQKAAERSVCEAGHGGVIFVQERSSSLCEDTATFSRRKATCGSLNEAHAESVLECGQRSRHSGGRSAQPAGRGGQTPVVNHGNQNSELLQAVHLFFQKKKF